MTIPVRVLLNYFIGAKVFYKKGRTEYMIISAPKMKYSVLIVGCLSFPGALKPHVKIKSQNKKTRLASVDDLTIIQKSTCLLENRT